MKIDKVYQEELFQRLLRGSNLKKEQALFRQVFQQPTLWLINGVKINKPLLLDHRLLCAAGRGHKCLKCLQAVLRKSRRTRRIEKFHCPQLNYGFCLPLAQGGALYGFLVLCHLKTEPTAETLRFCAAFNNIILEKVQKELELSKLYQTIRPRAIALSTIHTVHRLISSSLNLDELLPRIARLSLQILRAKRCLISLADKKTKQLALKAVVDLSKKGLKLRKGENIKHIENRVLRTGNILLNKLYISVPLIDEDPIGVITVFKKMSHQPFDKFDREILTALSEQAVGAIKNAQLYKEQESMILGTVRSLATLLKAKSPHSYTHSEEFVNIVLGIARQLRIPEGSLQDLRYAAMLHDAERVGIPEEILRKPTHLTGKELKIVKAHPKKSVRILTPLERLKPAIAIILHHHEKFDGSGYPDKLSSTEIPLGSRILAVADSFEAMISQRPYRKSTPISSAIKEIKRHSGGQFDPAVIDAFVKFTQSKSFKRIVKRIHYGRSRKNL